MKEKRCFCCGSEKIVVFIDGYENTIYLCDVCEDQFPYGEEYLIEVLERFGLELGVYDENE